MVANEIATNDQPSLKYLKLSFVFPTLYYFSLLSARQLRTESRLNGTRHSIMFFYGGGTGVDPEMLERVDENNGTEKRRKSGV